MAGRPADAAGLHACQAAVDGGQAERLFLISGKLNKRQQHLLDSAKAAQVAVERVDTTALITAAPAGLRHQGAVLWKRRNSHAHTGPVHWEDCLTGTETPLLLVLDGVEDPRNLGACLRSADGAGADGVIVPRGRGAPMSAVVTKTAAGAAESLKYAVAPNLAQALDGMRDRGVTVIGLADDADAELYDMDLRGPCAFVMGNEGQGLRRLTRDHCDAIASLPMRGSVSSLNVSVATGVVLYEALRQRRSGNSPVR